MVGYGGVVRYGIHVGGIRWDMVGWWDTVYMLVGYGGVVCYSDTTYSVVDSVYVCGSADCSGISGIWSANEYTAEWSHRASLPLLGRLVLNTCYNAVCLIFRVLPS